jgi:SET domain-containing protein
LFVYFIQAGQFVIEYFGEVISCKEAKCRSHTYETQDQTSIKLTFLSDEYLVYVFVKLLFAFAGLKDAFIISLNASESIDATRKGSLARFINHSW